METLKTIFNTSTTTGIIAIIALISPIVVAMINNFFSYFMRRLEFKARMKERQFDTYYTDKKEAFTEFVKDASELVTCIKSGNRYQAIFNSIHKAMLFSNEDNKKLLSDFLEYVNDILFHQDNLSKEWQVEYMRKYTHITHSLNIELMETANEIK